VRDVREAGFHVVLVSSGAVGVGGQRLGLAARPAEMARKQALAAIGQVHLMRHYEDMFSAVGITCAQVLLTADNLSCRGQYAAAAACFSALLQYGAVPVVNENDTVAVEQLRVGDNDTLSAQVATLVHAEWLFLLTDVDALYTANPADDPSAQPIRHVPDLWSLTVDTGAVGAGWSTGGMATKLTAARIATAGGCNMGIAHFRDPSAVLRIMRGEALGTVFAAAAAPVRGRKRWLTCIATRGELWLDDGAVAAVGEHHHSLFPAGIKRAAGDFDAGDCVRLCDAGGREFARGLVNYSAAQVARVKGKSSAEAAASLGPAAGTPDVVHRGNVCLLVDTSGAAAEYGDLLDDEHAARGAARRAARSGAAAEGAAAAAGVGGAAASAEDGARALPAGPVSDIAARLAELRARVEAEEEPVDWLVEAAAAARAEGAAEAAAEAAASAAV
jgi:glutamate 5-kinase